MTALALASSALALLWVIAWELVEIKRAARRIAEALERRK